MGDLSLAPWAETVLAAGIPLMVVSYVLALWFGIGEN